MVKLIKKKRRSDMARRKNKVSSMLTVLFVLIGAVIFLLFNNGAPAQEENREVSDVSGAMELYVLDVGQADALLIKSEEGNILFDSGDLDTKKELIAELEELGVKKIEYAVFTHPHADHIGAADLVLTTFEVKNVILPVVDDKDVPTSKVYERMITALENNEAINVIAAEPDAEYSVGEVKMKILAPNSADYSDLNNYSVVVRVDYGATSFMLTGDAEDVSEEEMLARYPESELKCNFYKAAHHGARESNTAAFLKAVSPEIIAVSCGEGNSYGHPHAEAMARFEDTGAVIYRTDLLGRLVFRSDGTTVTKVN
jgi:competence protein ComEC